MNVKEHDDDNNNGNKNNMDSGKKQSWNGII